jgi:hypothetical protein
MPPPPSLFFVPDLNILICDPNRYRFDFEALRNFLQPLLNHLNAFENQKERYPNTFICLSESLKQAVLAEFPWNQEDLPPDLIDIYTAILPVLNSARDRTITAGRAQRIAPDLTSGLYFASGTTVQAWQTLVKSSENCWSGEGQAEYIKILSDQEILLRVSAGGEDLYLAEIFPPGEWEAVCAWAIEGLPRMGDMPYHPHDSWHRGQNFPRGGEGSNRGWRDRHDRVWTWDYLHGGTHWHVVVSRRHEWQREYEVTPDGRIHHRY